MLEFFFFYLTITFLKLIYYNLLNQLYIIEHLHYFQFFCFVKNGHYCMVFDHFLGKYSQNWNYFVSGNEHDCIFLNLLSACF